MIIFYKPFAFLFFFSLIAFFAGAQVFQDDFSDGDFTSNPAWYGNTDHFIVNSNFELQLNAPVAGTSYLMGPVQTGNAANWEFYFRLEFPPSGSNRLRVYLQSDNPVLTGPLNGYFLEIGEGGNEDAIELRRQTGSSTSVVLRGTDGEVAFDPAGARVRVIRESNGNWELWADYTGGEDLTLNASGNDNTYTSGQYFGFHCLYTATRVNHFFFDDVKIEPVIPDTDPPFIQQVTALSDTEVQITFNEPIDQANMDVVSNYTINQGVNVNAVELGLNHVLMTTSELQSGINHTVAVLSVSDLSENTATNLQGSFVYLATDQPMPGDILITEIMADPTPPVGLPNAEYVELYNASEKNLNLLGLNFSDGGAGANLPFHIIQPGEYVIITRVADAPDFEVFGTVIGVSGFPNLVNAGDEIYLKNAEGDILHEVFYRDSWYNDAEKAGGGWALEMINPQSYCIQQENWTASNAFLGGTPGTQNSVWNDVPDIEGPTIMQVEAFSADEIFIRFSKEPSADAFNPESYSILPFVGSVTLVGADSDPKNAILKIEEPFLQDGQIYTVIISNQITDCLGNPASGTGQFLYTETFEAQPYDIVISEIMANPNPPVGLPNSKYVELYNRSDRAFNLRNFLLLDRTRTANLPNYILLPGEYVLFHGANLTFFEGIENAVYVSGFIEPRISGDDLELLNPNGEIIHAVYYTSSWYRNSTKSNGGWSLEMINPADPCVGSENWMASNELIGGTPGRENSVMDAGLVFEPLRALRAYPASANQVRIYFNRSVNRAMLMESNPFSISGRNITALMAEEPLYRSVLLTLNQPMEEEVVYTIEIDPAMEDCIQTATGQTLMVRVGLPSKPEPLDLIINELLYDPETGGSRFIEFYNRSTKVIDLKGLVIADRDASGNIDRASAITADFLSFPGDYNVITPDVIYITDRYSPPMPEWLVQSGLPALDRSSGTVLVYFADIFAPLILDEFAYSNALHSGLLSNRSGVSLERLDPERATNDASNWHSAAQSVGFGTPTGRNSQYTAGIGGDLPDYFVLANNRISPDGDGFEDVLLIYYALDLPGYIATMNIYDSHGRRIKSLTNQELLGMEGIFQWDGATDNETKASVGIHVLHIQYFHPAGITRSQKIPFVVAARL